MVERYESISDVLAVLKKQRIQATRQEVQASLTQLGLREPFGAGDVAELIDHLGPQRVVNRRLSKTARVLASKKWADAVVRVRCRSGLPAGGLSEEEARELHRDLMESIASRRHKVWIIRGKTKPVIWVWRDLIAETRVLYPLLAIDPRALDKLRVAYAQGVPNTQFGVRTLLDPESTFLFGEQEMPYRPNQTDHLLAHVLWHHPLDPKVMEPKPSVSYEWQWLEDGGGRFISHIFNEKEATASELRKSNVKMQEIKRSFRDRLLLAVVDEVAECRELSWEQRWERWNQLCPDFAVQSPEALRKACAYAQKNRDQIRERYERLARPS